MEVLGTKQFWIAAPGSTQSQQQSQILKNSGYVSLQLYCANYFAEGNRWQKWFGGKDTITLSTNLKYQRGDNSIIEASSVQDIRKIKPGKPTNLALQRNVAVKLPATADALSLDIILTAVKDDVLQAKFDMLNKPEFQSALQLVPSVVGQIVTVTSLVKKLLTDSEANSQLQANYAAIISNKSETNPVAQGRLTAGYLILIDNNEGSSFTEVDSKDLSLKGNALYYKEEEVSNTYVIFNISFDALKGENQTATWFKKYKAALNKLDDLIGVKDNAEIVRIYEEAKKYWIEGNALLEEDETYINGEKVLIKAAAFTQINDRYQELTQKKQGEASAQTALAKDVLTELSGATENVATISAVLPETGNLLGVSDDRNDAEKVVSRMIPTIASIGLNAILGSITKDVGSYLNDLKKNNSNFNLTDDTLIKASENMAYINAIMEAARNQSNNIEYYYNLHKSTAENTLAAREYINTYKAEELERIRERLDNCVEKGIEESLAERARCMCFVLKDVKAGNGGDIPVQEWEETYKQLKCK